MSATSRWLVVSALSILAAMSQLDGPSELQAAQDVADEAEYAAAQADGGAAKCAGLGSTPKWLPDGSLRCRPLPVTRPALLAQGGAP